MLPKPDKYRKVATLLSYMYWHYAFKEAKRVKIIFDGHYQVSTDIDALYMYCMGQEL